MTKVLVLLAALAMMPALARADTLYGLSSSNPGTVYTIDTSTGAATAVVNLVGTIGTSLVDISFLNGTLYASDVVSSTGVFTFGSINLITGVYTPINDQGGSVNWHSLAAIPSANLLYAVDLQGEQLVSVTPAGTISVVGNTNQQIVDLAYDPNHNVLYGVDLSRLFTINPSTGAATLVGSTGVLAGAAGLAYDSGNNTLYLNTAGSSIGNFYTVNISTGQATFVGSNTGAGQGIDGLADTNGNRVPEPSTVLLLISGFAGLGMSKYCMRLFSRPTARAL